MIEQKNNPYKEVWEKRIREKKKRELIGIIHTSSIFEPEYVEMVKDRLMDEVI